jgi:phenylacetate-CoA ligase
MYTCQEAGYLALQCPEHPHYHVQAENILLEVVDDTGRPCGPGEVGRVLITSLNNFATPLIRYELGDYAKVGEPCPCGRGLPVLKRIMGRYRNLLRLPDGTRRWARLGYETSLHSIAPIELMQMIQTSLDEIKVRLVMARPLDDSEIRALTAFIHANLGYAFRLSFEYVDSIRNPANGKVEQFISLIEAAR